MNLMIMLIRSITTMKVHTMLLLHHAQGYHRHHHVLLVTTHRTLDLHLGHVLDLILIPIAGLKVFILITIMKTSLKKTIKKNHGVIILSDHTKAAEFLINVSSFFCQ